jgi:hypothetical protein
MSDSPHEPESMRYQGTTFALQDVRLDGVQFDHCRFGSGSRLHFAGKALPTFTECDIAEDVEFVLASQAKLTMQFLSLFYHHGGKGGRETVERVVEQLYWGAFEPNGPR